MCEKTETKRRRAKRRRHVKRTVNTVLERCFEYANSLGVEFCIKERNPKFAVVRCDLQGNAGVKTWCEFMLRGDERDALSAWKAAIENFYRRFDPKLEFERYVQMNNIDATKPTQELIQKYCAFKGLKSTLLIVYRKFDELKRPYGSGTEEGSLSA